jgi:ubiquinone/menaquinone biosynthesis C-methylase UbiE
MTIELSARDISEKYDRFARWYDCFEAILNFLGLGGLRHRLIDRASCEVLEVAVGTGRNLAYYPSDCRIIAVDLSREMLKVARNKAAKLSVQVSFILTDGETLPFRDGRFDTVVTSLSTCTFPNPVLALKEIKRVCHPAGKVLLLEHGRSDRERLGRWQDRHADSIAKQLGCHWNREPLAMVLKAGLNVRRARRLFFGIFYQIEAAPGSIEPSFEMSALSW